MAAAGTTWFVCKKNKMADVIEKENKMAAAGTA
jgi:hypothetical protein